MKKLTVLFIVCMSLSLSAQPGAFSLAAPSNGGWGSATPTFQWGAASGASFYRLFIDGVLKDDNLTSTSYQLLSSEALTEPLHTWYVIAVDAGSATTQSSQTFTVKVDATPPAAFNLTNPADGSWSNSLQPTLQWSLSSDGVSGIAKYQLWIDGTLNRDNISSSLDSTTPNSILTNGIHTWQVKAIDSVGNIKNSTQTWTIKVDNIPPIGTHNNILTFNGTTNYGRSTVYYNGWAPNTFTLECWFNTTTTQGGWLIGLGDTPDGKSGKRDRHIYMTNDGRLIFGVYNTGGGTILTSSGRYNDGIWHHVAASLSTNGMKLYIDGNLAVSNSGVTGGSQFGGYWKFGFDDVSDWPNGPTSNYFSGNMDEIRIWHIERTALQINQWKNISLAGNESGLYLYFPITALDGGNTLTNYCTNNSYGGYLYNVPSVNSYLPPIGNLCILKTPSNGIFSSNATPTFSWGSTSDTGSGFQKYQLIIDSSIVKDNLTDSSWTIATPLSSGQHYWYIKGFDLIGNSNSSLCQIFYIDNNPPNAFNLLTPLDSAVVNIPTPNLTWQATLDSAGGSGLSKYQLWINGAKNIDSIPITSKTTAPSAVLIEGGYTWFIKAIDKVGNVRTSTQTRTFFVDFNPPGAFTLLSPAKGDTVKASRPKFVWHKSIDAGSGIKRYVLNVSGQTPDTIATADTSAQFPTSLANGPYTWFVVAYDRGNNSKGSDTGNFVVNILPPTVPVLASPSNRSSNLPTLFRLKWFSSTGADSYKIQVSVDSTFNSTFAENKAGLTDTTDSISTALSQNTLYYWRVNATNSAATCAWSDIWNFMTIVPVPTKVSIVVPANAATIVVDSLNIVWSKATPSVDKYCLEIASDSLFATKITSDSTITDTSKMCKGLTNKMTYWFHVKAHNSSGWGSFSDTRKFTVNFPTAVLLPKTFSFKFSGISASNSFIRYSLPKECDVSFKLFNVQGKLIRTFINANQSAGNYQIPLNIADLSRGCYLMDFKAGSFAVKRKMLNY
jgi:Laminin G domain.